MDRRITSGDDRKAYGLNGTVSIADRIKPVAVGGSVLAIRFLGDVAGFILAEDSVVLAGADGAVQRVDAHGGGILSAASDGARILTGGDDGKVVATSSDGATVTLATDTKRRWIDHVAAGPDGAIAWSAGKQVFTLTGKGEERAVEVVSTAGGLAFAPKGLRLAIAHYNGVSLWFPNAKAAPEKLEWKGSHVSVTFSPDGRFIVTAMQEPMLHGWRVSDGHHMRMSGYATKVRSIDWTIGGKALATAGSTQLVVWPFVGKDGPMGKQPKLLAPSEQKVTTVACHPAQEVTATGFEDGMVLLVRMEDGAEILAKPPGGGAITALAWNASGTLLAFGTDEDSAGLLAV